MKPAKPTKFEDKHGTLNSSALVTTMVRAAIGYLIITNLTLKTISTLILVRITPQNRSKHTNIQERSCVANDCKMTTTSEMNARTDNMIITVIRMAVKATNNKTVGRRDIPLIKQGKHQQYSPVQLEVVRTLTAAA
eukprot:scaffold28787_cov32-Prasinocladus_malaysianus.AAC.1